MTMLSRAALLCSALAILPFGAGAQTMSAEEILKRIQLQREALEKAKSEERTRTLSFVPNSTPSPAPGQTEAAAIVPATPTATGPGSLVTPAAPELAATGTLTAPPAADASTAGIVPRVETVAAPVASTAPPLPAVATDAVPTLSTDLAIDLVIFFEFDSAILKREAKAQLDELCKGFQADAGTYQIIGHTDAAGTDAYNLTLSRARAEEVVRHLVASCGIAEGRLKALGLGEAKLKDSANPRDAVNRRVEIQVAS